MIFLQELKIMLVDSTSRQSHSSSSIRLSKDLPISEDLFKYHLLSFLSAKDVANLTSSNKKLNALVEKNTNYFISTKQKEIIASIKFIKKNCPQFAKQIPAIIQTPLSVIQEDEQKKEQENKEDKLNPLKNLAEEMNLLTGTESDNLAKLSENDLKFLYFAAFSKRKNINYGKELVSIAFFKQRILKKSRPKDRGTIVAATLQSIVKKGFSHYLPFILETVERLPLNIQLNEKDSNFIKKIGKVNEILLKRGDILNACKIAKSIANKASYFSNLKFTDLRRWIIEFFLKEGDIVNSVKAFEAIIKLTNKDSTISRNKFDSFVNYSDLIIEHAIETNNHTEICETLDNLSYIKKSELDLCKGKYTDFKTITESILNSPTPGIPNIAKALKFIAIIFQKKKHNEATIALSSIFNMLLTIKDYTKNLTEQEIEKRKKMLCYDPTLSESQSLKLTFSALMDLVLNKENLNYNDALNIIKEASFDSSLQSYYFSQLSTLALKNNNFSIAIESASLISVDSERNTAFNNIINGIPVLSQELVKLS